MNTPTPFIHPISGQLTAWYRLHRRDLPWRQTNDPYAIWLSEIILQQTRVDQGLPYYLHFLEAFPAVQNLANATEDQILKLWQGLGYYSRARNLHRTAKLIRDRFKGRFPEDFDTLLSLPGIGDYTAAAIASFAFNRPHAVVDGNVNRVISRIFGIYEPINTTKGQKIFRELATELLSTTEPATHNQAIMEFGALWCKPQSPDCNNCILLSGCFAGTKQLANELPVKVQKVKVRTRYFNYLIIRDKEHIYLRKRKDKGIWQHLYELPYIETQAPASDLTDTGEWKSFFGNRKPEVIKEIPNRLHKLTHQHISFNYREVVAGNGTMEPQGHWIRVPIREIDNYPVPKPVESIFKEVFPGYDGFSE